MLYPNHQHRSQSRHPPRTDYQDYQDDDDAYYLPTYSRPPPQQSAGSSRRRPNPLPKDPGHIHFYHRHRDDRDSWAPSGPNPDLAPQPPRRQSSTTTNSTSDYGVHPRSRRGRSSSASRVARSKSSSPRRHATPLPTAPSLPQPSLSERETLVRQRLQTTFETYVFNTLPTHLLRVTDMTLVARNEVWEMFKPRIESLSDSHLAKLLLEQDEEARRLGVSVIDPQVLAPFTKYIRAMISFATFSHRWDNGEPLFHELPSKRFQVGRRSAPSGPGYQKLLKFCEKARMDYDCEYVWTDTCCINKESSTELEEAILSMGVWYSEAGVCIVHLGNSSTLEDFMSEPWFTRGWTLQELLLPRKIRFYGRDWSPICPAVGEGRREERGGKDDRDDQRVNDKDNDSVVAAITKVTGIPEADIRTFIPSCTRVSEKMRWASQRTTSRIEDVAYALLGLFDVTIPIAYGDGPRAFYKLMSALAGHCTEPDFFAWTGKPSSWSLALPSSPQCYGPQASPFQTDLVTPSTSSALALGDPAYELTKLGLRTRLVFVPAYCEPLEPTDVHTARLLLTPALATAGADPDIRPPRRRRPTTRVRERAVTDREREIQVGRGREREREREYALSVVDYDMRPGPPGYAALHAGRPHLCMVLERRGRGCGWVRVARPGALSVRFRESELLPVEEVCLLHRAS
ncbi:hypothetical protein J3R82DRAFT_11839 [Butyriboletus roseoflavus]|nr:hypothetical protein J3R82DRAFT_11839 [Butyriboletus roseoflavus]